MKSSPMKSVILDESHASSSCKISRPASTDELIGSDNEVTAFLAAAAAKSHIFTRLRYLHLLSSSSRLLCMTIILRLSSQIALMIG